jgi:hypothetical protein
MKKKILIILILTISICSAISCNAVSPSISPIMPNVTSSIPITTTNLPAMSPTSVNSPSFITPPLPQPFEISARLPAGWARNDKPVISRDPLGHGPIPIIAFNSWGDIQYCAGYTQNGGNISYGLQTIMPQLKSGGAYIVMNEQTYFPGGIISSLPPEYTPNDLSGLHDYFTSSWFPFSDPPISVGSDFYKRCHFLDIWILCTSNASKTIVQQLNDLLNNWRFVN